MDLSILDLNVWNVNEPLNERLTVVGDFVQAEFPDIVCLQEVPVIRGEPIYPTAMLELDYHCIYLPSGKWEGREEGLAICSRRRGTVIGAPLLKDGVGDIGRSALAVRVRPNPACGPILVVTTHLAYRPEHADVRRAQAEGVADTIVNVWQRFGWIPTIVCGDFNCADSESAVQTLLNPAPDVRLRDVQAEAGQSHLSTFDERNPFVSADLWPNRRIDYLLVSEDWSLKEFRIVLHDVSEGRLASDHYGLYARLEVA